LLSKKQANGASCFLFDNYATRPASKPGFISPLQSIDAKLLLATDVTTTSFKAKSR
jgi:hypothetical protein